jgi:hypothetical protein
MQKSSIRPFQVLRAGATALLSLTWGLPGCSTSDTVILTSDPRAPSTPGASAATVGETSGSQYVISTRVFSTDLSTEVGYLTTASSLAAGATFDLDDAVEIPESGIAFNRPEDPWIYWASITEPTITRWEVAADGTFTKGPSVSFANLGLTDASAAADSPIFSSNKSYFVDQGQGVVVVWDPGNMILLDTIPLDITTDEVLSPIVFSGLGVRGDRLFASMFSWSDEDWTQLGDHSRLFVIDATSDTVVKTTDESRCNQLALGGISSDGTAYFSARSYFTLPRLVFGAGFGAEACSLRVVAPDEEFDQGFDLDLSSLVGGRPAGDFTLVTDDTAFIRVWHTESVSEPTEANWDTLRNEAGFRWWRWHIGAPSAEEIVDQESAANTVQLRRVDGKVYGLRYTPDYSTTTLEELRADGTIVPGLTGPGGVYGVIRMR